MAERMITKYHPIIFTTDSETIRRGGQNDLTKKRGTQLHKLYTDRCFLPDLTGLGINLLTGALNSKSWAVKMSI